MRRNNLFKYNIKFAVFVKKKHSKRLDPRRTLPFIPLNEKHTKMRDEKYMPKQHLLEHPVIIHPVPSKYLCFLKVCNYDVCLNRISVRHAVAGDLGQVREVAADGGDLPQ